MESPVYSKEWRVIKMKLLKCLMLIIKSVDYQINFKVLYIVSFV